MPEKGGSFKWIWRQNPVVHGWFKILIVGLFLGILIVWGIDSFAMSSSFEKNFVMFKVDVFRNLTGSYDDSTSRTVSQTDSVPSFTPEQASFERQDNPPEQAIERQDNPPEQASFERQDNPPELPSSVETQFNDTSVQENNLPDEQIPAPSKILPWISSGFEANYSSNLLANWLKPGGEPCKDSKTVDIKISGMDGLENLELSTGDIHEFVFQTVDDSGAPHCIGGDYFETDLSGESWKARPPVKDVGDGTYTVSLQVHPDFAGEYNLTIILLYRHYEGLKFSPARFAFDKILRVIPVRFHKSDSKLSEVNRCKKSDYDKDVWSGRWTRHARNDSCPISEDGRYRCQEPNFPCQRPWCDGPLGSLESNGWVYSSHCSFKLFSGEESWNCLNNRWIFWWGDSNHCDTIRNILHFLLDVHDVAVVPRYFDMNITNPRNPSQVVRFTSVFNGHPNDTGNYQGLNSLINAQYQDRLKGYFSQDTVPDTLIMNSGLHDGVFWHNIRGFIQGADYAAGFWAEVMKGLKDRGVARPLIVYRTTVATGGYARSLAFNPSKMESFNGVVLENLRQYGLVDRVVDDFDMTYPWHYDNRCNDGVHYGRGPLKMKWRDGQIGHQYFVDLMLCHVLLNTVCHG